MYGPRNDHLTGASQAGHPPGIGGGLAVEHRFVDVALPGVHTDPSIDSGTGELEGERGGASHRMGGPVEGGDELVAAVADGSPSVAVHQVRKEAGLGLVRFVGLDGHDGGQNTMNLSGGWPMMKLASAMSPVSMLSTSTMRYAARSRARSGGIKISSRLLGSGMEMTRGRLSAKGGLL